MSGLHTRNLEIFGVMGASPRIHSNSKRDGVTDGGLRQHQRGWRTALHG